MCLQIYSIVHGVVRVELLDEHRNSINQTLVDHCIADYANEAYNSQVYI